jgi:glutamate racemase
LELLAEHLEPIQDAGADTLVLGCTHYPFLRKAIRKLLGESITLIDTSDAVVRQLKRQLESLHKESSEKEFGSVLFLSSKNEKLLLSMAQDLMSADLTSHAVDANIFGEVK